MADLNLKHIANGRVRSQANETSFDLYLDPYKQGSPIYVHYTEHGRQRQEVPVDRKTLVPLVDGVSIPIEVKCALIVHSRPYQ